MAHSDLFIKTCIDTRTAWKATNLAAKVQSAQVERLNEALRTASAKELANFLMEISYAPYSGAAANLGLNDGNANRLSCTLMTAILMPYISMRGKDESINLDILKLGMITWIDSAVLPPQYRPLAAELDKITALIDSSSARISLTAPFAAPIEFSLQALAIKMSQQDSSRERDHVQNN